MLTIVPMTSRFFDKIRSVLLGLSGRHIAALVLNQPVFLASVLVTGLLIGVRQLGVLETLELYAFDQLLRLRPDEGSDPRLLVVAVTEEDIQRYGRPLPDRTVNELLKQLESYQPRVIGLDIFRDIQIGKGRADLVQRLQQSDRTIVICGVHRSVANDPGIPPSPGVPQDRIGFADVVTDSGGIVRRHLLWLPPVSSEETTPAPQVQHPCKNYRTRLYSFSLQVALHYLKEEGIQPEFPPPGYLKLGSTVFKPIEKNTGGYQQADQWGDQVLLNYRSAQHSTKQVTLTEVLKGEVNPNWVKDRVVVIGYTAVSVQDNFYTPYSTKQQQTHKMPGAIVHAQMVSQILSTVLDARPLIWSWPEWGEVLWIWIWSLVGGSLTWRVRHSPLLGLAGGATLGTLFGICYGLSIQGGWMPLVPSALVLVATGGSVVAVAYRAVKS